MLMLKIFNLYLFNIILNILEKCEYVQAQFSIQGQTSELVLRNPIQMCNRYMTDILSYHQG
jgi:hypothetical protein